MGSSLPSLAEVKDAYRLAWLPGGVLGVSPHLPILSSLPPVQRHHSAFFRPPSPASNVGLPGYPSETPKHSPHLPGVTGPAGWGPGQRRGRRGLRAAG